MLNKIKFGVAALTLGLGLLASTSPIEALSIEEIQEKGELVVGTNAEYPPMEWVIIEDGESKIVGVDVELAQAIADELGVEMVLDNRAFDALIPTLQTKKVDIVIAGMAETEERAKVVDFSDTYYQSSGQISVLEENLDQYETIEDFNGKKVGALKGSIQESYLRDNHPEIELVSLGGTGELFEAVRAKKVDGALVDMITTGQYLTQYEDIAPVESIEIENEDSEGSAVAAPKDSDELIALINEVIAEKQESGEIDEWFDTYLELSGKELADGE